MLSPFLALWHSVPAMPSPFCRLWYSVQAMPSHFGFVVLAAGNALLLSAVCGIRYRRGPSMVRNMRAVLKKASWGTRRIFRGIRCKKQAFPVQKGYSVRRTASRGTRRIMDIRCSPPSLVRNRSLGAKKGHHRNNTKKTGQILRLVLFSSGGWTRTNDLRVMSPTSYQLLYPAMFGNTKVGICFEFAKFFSLLLQILRSAARFLPAPRLFSSAEELSH